MEKKTMKIVSSLLVIMFMIGTISAPVLAFNYTDSTGYSPDGSKANTTVTDKAGSIMNTIIGVVQVIGIAIAVIMLIFVAIKYLTSAPNDKAEIKKHAVVYVVGAIVLFGASGILGIIKQFAGQLGQP